jgi:hypothetical protein
MGRWARRSNRTVISLSVMAISAGMSMRSRRVWRAWADPGTLSFGDDFAPPAQSLCTGASTSRHRGWTSPTSSLPAVAHSRLRRTSPPYCCTIPCDITWRKCRRRLAIQRPGANFLTALLKHAELLLFLPEPRREALNLGSGHCLQGNVEPDPSQGKARHRFPLPRRRPVVAGLLRGFNRRRHVGRRQTIGRTADAARLLLALERN